MKCYHEKCRIYVASLSDYNNGILYGKWIDLDFITAEEVQEQVNEMLEGSPSDPAAEEWAIHDYELGGFEVEEYDSFEHCVRLVELLDEYGEKIVGLYNNCPSNYNDLDQLKEDFDKYYRGSYDSKKEYAEEYADQTLENLGIELPGMIPIDYEGVLINLECNGTWFTERIDGMIHAFDQ